MINSKKDLEEYLKADNNWYQPVTLKEKFIDKVAHYPWRSVKKYLFYLRKHEYYYNTTGNDPIKKLLKLYYERRKNLLGERLGIEIPPNCFGKGLNIYHAGCIVVNVSVKAGENCSLHGNNCIGNNGITKEAPILGDNVDVGFGASIIGDVMVGDNTIIGANAVVTKSFQKPGNVIAGVPAAVIRHN